MDFQSCSVQAITKTEEKHNHREKIIYIFFVVVCLVIKLCLILCNPMDCSPPGFSVHEISQARFLESAAISFSRGSSWPRDQTCVSWLAGRFFTTEPPGKPCYIHCVCIYYVLYICICVLSHFSCVWLCDPMECSLPGFSVHGILQVRILKWVAIPSSMGSSWPKDQTHIF